MVSLYNPIQCFETKWETLEEEKNTGTHLFDTLQPLHRGNIPLSPLLDLRKDPWFDQRSSRDHHSIHATPLHFLIIGCGRKTITVSKDGNRGKVGVSNGLAEGGDAVLDVFPVGRFGIALLARSTVNLEGEKGCNVSVGSRRGVWGGEEKGERKMTTDLQSKRPLPTQ